MNVAPHLGNVHFLIPYSHTLITSNFQSYAKSNSVVLGNSGSGPLWEMIAVMVMVIFTRCGFLASITFFHCFIYIRMELYREMT